MPEEAVVSDIAVVLFVVGVEVHAHLVRGDVPVEFAFFLVRAGAAVLATEWSFGAVVVEVAVGEDFVRFGVKPPVEQVEVVCGFVYEEGAGAVSQAVPAAEVAGAVVGVEHPVEVGGDDVADGAFLEELFDLGHVRAPAVVEADDDLVFGVSFGVEDGLALVFVGGHGFFGEDVAAVLEGFDDELVVCGVHGGDDDEVGASGGDHFVEVGEGGAVGADVGFTEFESARVLVAEAYELEEVGEVFDDVFAPEGDAADAGSDEGDFSFGGGGLGEE